MSQLEEIRARHYPWPEGLAPAPPARNTCVLDNNQFWPCDAAVLLSTVEKQQRVIEAARVVAGTRADSQSAENLKALRSALDA
ncbi:MAG: hypothetical protein WBF51_04030, partial [Candidatus Dormiibacterota bacterium]